MKRKEPNIQGSVIHLDIIDESSFISLKDIARQSKNDEPRFIIRNWMTSQQTLCYTAAWEKLHNPELQVLLAKEFQRLKQEESDRNSLEWHVSKLTDNSEYISLTDIAKKSNSKKPDVVIQNWLKNISTIRYLHAWERIHNPDINPLHLHGVLDVATDNRLTMSPKKWIEITNAIGIYTKMGRGGGTFAHKDIALNFCYWLSPEFQVYFIKEFQRLKEEESERQNLEWHISKITDNIDEVRNLLDTIPHQKPKRNRLKGGKDTKG